MARAALSATRAVAVLDFLAANTTEGFTLTEVASRLGINVASTHALLTVLTEAGYVVRHPRLRTFTLGPSVVALGSAALECHPVVDLARDAARELASQTGLEVAVTAPAGNHIVFLARAGEPSARGVPVHVGQRVPLVPPLGSVFVAWDGADTWLARADDPDALREVLDVVRSRGYSVAIEADARKALGHALDDLAGRPANDGLRASVEGLVTDLGQREYQVRRLEAKQDYDVSMIAAPVFGPAGDVVLAFTLLGFDAPLRGSEIAAYGEQLRDIGLIVTRRSRGREPTSESDR
jgi:DNA-binding IclR family transcriptional regulator